MNQQYTSLLEQVGQQHSIIQQLSELQGTQNSGEKNNHVESEETETGGKWELFFFMRHWCYFDLNSICIESSVMHPWQRRQDRLMQSRHSIQIWTPLQWRNS